MQAQIIISLIFHLPERKLMFYSVIVSFMKWRKNDIRCSLSGREYPLSPGKFSINIQTEHRRSIQFSVLNLIGKIEDEL